MGNEGKGNSDYHYLQDLLQFAYKDHGQPQLCQSAHSVGKMIPPFASHQVEYGCYCEEESFGPEAICSVENESHNKNKGINSINNFQPNN